MKKWAIILFLVIPSSIMGVWLYLEIPFVSRDAVHSATAALKRHEGKELQKGTCIIVDYSRPSHTKRLAVMDLETGTLGGFSRVAHGRNSGVVFAGRFSNQEGSLQSSTGLFLVGDAFDGTHGPSLRLTGLEPGRNDHALKRGIIVHSAPYVSLKSMVLNWRSGFRLGRSQGCFALSHKAYNRLMGQLVRPAYVYAYAGEP